MKNKTWTKIAFYTIVFGWLIFMFVCTCGAWLEPIYRVMIVVSGVLFCFLGTAMIHPILQNSDLFKSIDELEEERNRYYEATQRLVKKIKEL